MADSQSSSNKDDFLFPRSKYWGKFTPKHLAFNANLQEFAQRVSFICNLETGGKIPAHEAYDEIKRLWQTLKVSKANLLDTDDLPPDELPPESDSSP